ncbi:Uma2 family endonuclease [Desulfobacterales bacterium HSG2]|nr:Uma2 family endonuclease [Desulfobacterales bacterium HSG2]
MGEPAEQKTCFTREEYLALEDRANYKSEFYDGEIFALAGGIRNHSVICLNLNWGIRNGVADKDCVGFDSNMKLDIAEHNLFVYPDAMVVCGEIGFSENRTDIVTNPVLIIEVISPSTEKFDRGDKFAYYRSLPSLREYVLISQNEPMVEVYYKQDEKTWIYTVSKGLEESVRFQTIDYEMSLKDIYQKVNLHSSESHLSVC